MPFKLKHGRDPDALVALMARLPAELVEKLRASAARNNRSVNAEANVILERAFMPAPLRGMLNAWDERERNNAG